MTVRNEIWYDLDAPGRKFMQRVHDSVLISTSIGMFFQWVVWDYAFSDIFNIHWDPGTSKIFSI